MIIKAHRVISNFIIFMIIRFIAIIVNMTSEKYNNIWIIAERGYDARDNGFHLFEYINRYHPSIDPYYVIDYNSSDYEKVKNIGKTVHYRSMKHYFLFAISKVKISTHIMGYSPDMGAFRTLDNLRLIPGKKVFLQHGITKDNLEQLYYPNVKLDLFVCGAYPEYEYISKTFNHKPGVVQCLGLCRYDNLHIQNQTKKTILLMPTWRTYVGECKNIEEFKQTKYYGVYQSLLNNTELHELLKMYEYELIFYPHYEIQKYLTLFYTDFKGVKLASFGDYDVQKLLVESSILITDFSSVFFDFAYLKKPEIFYQFDVEDYRNKHYQEGYFSYEKNGFGPVVADENKLLIELEEILKKDAKIEQKYLDRINSFFTMNDNKNCSRNFEAIKDLL